MGEAGDDMIIPIGKRWYDLMPLVKSSFKTSSKFDESKLRQEADQLINGDRKKFLAYKQAKNKADFDWINSVLTSGSFTDRLSAYTLLIQESPIHNIYSIQKLLDIINPKVVRECLMTMDNLKDLLLSDLLPKRQLRKFSDLIQFLPVKDGVKRNQILMLIHFEDKIRAIYQEFQERLEKLSLDGPDALKSKAIHVMFDLLSSRFEHDKSLLEKLVNKFGDPAPKRASHVGYLLSKLVNQKKDSKLKVTVCKEVERVLFRPHINEKAQYYSLRFMSEVALSKSDSKLANHIIETYFKFFDASAKKSNLNNKMMNVLLTGLSRAFPYSNLEPKTLEERLESFYKLLHMVDKGTAVQGLSLIFNVLNIKDSGMIADRFYSVLYRSLHEINLDNCAKKGLFLSLLFKALKQDPVPVRIKAFIKRLLQQTLHYSPPVTCAILALVSEITKDRPDILRIRSTTVDEKITREPNSDDEEGDEFYEDVPISDDEKSAVKTNDSKRVDSTWIHQKNNKSNQVRDGRYDPFGRNPLFSNADCCDIWELNLLPSHFHPSAALFADKVANCHLIVYDGDPLLDFTSNNFLDRFVFRNPKKVEKEKASKSYKSTLFARASKSRDRIIPIQQLTQKSKSKIPLEERFIYDYLVQKKKEEKEKEDDNASVDSEDFDRILEKFEPDADDSFAEGLKRDKMKGRTSQDSDEDDGYPSSEDELGDDEDIDIDTDDEEYKAAFGDIDEEIADAKREAAMFEDDDDNDDDDDDGEGLSRFKRRGRDKSLTKLFAAADKFSHLLEGRESGDENNEDDDESGDDNRKGKKKRHKNFKKSRPNSRKSFKKDRNPKRRRR